MLALVIICAIILSVVVKKVSGKREISDDASNLTTNSEQDKKPGGLSDTWPITVLIKKIKTKKITIVKIWIFVIFVFSMTFGINAIMRNDDSFRTAISYIEASEEIRSIVGEITGYGFFVQGSINVSGGPGNASFLIRVIGEDGVLYVAVRLSRSPETDWQVVGVSH